MSRDKVSPAHIPALDGVRGVAVLVVMICHISERFQFSNPLLRGIKSVAFAGWTGVDLFFVLSGFLITGILWDAKGGSAYFRNFYARRTLRIFPLYYAALAMIFILVPAMAPKHADAGWLFPDLAPSRHYWAWYGSYLVDVLIAWKGFVFAGHFWTLAVEEHFYLVWPILVHRLERRALISTTLFLMAAALALRLSMVICQVSPTAIYVLTPCRMDALALGAFLALTLRGPDGLGTLVRLARLVLPLSAAMWIAIMCLAGGWSQYGPLAQTVGYVVTEMFYASVLVFTLASNRLATVMSTGSLRFLGKISYALYVFHVFVVILVARLFALGSPSHYSIVFSLMAHLVSGPFVPGALMLLVDAVVYVALAIGLCIGMALLSWHVLESPCLRLRRLFPYARKAAAGRISEPAQSKELSV